MRNMAVGLLICSVLANAPVRAEGSTVSMSPDDVRTALAAIDDAKKIVVAGRSSLLMAGSALSTNELSSSMVLVVLDYPKLKDMKSGSILLLAKKNCEPIENCLVARRLIRRDSSGNLETERYGSAQPILLASIQATLLGTVVYAVDLHTGDIRDMRPDRKSERLSAAEAVAQEASR
jgi:hypothetical protein